MKKVFVIALAVVLAVTFAVPAMAYQFKLGARIQLDLGWAVWNQGGNVASFAGNRFAAGSQPPDITSVFVAMPSTSYLRATFMSDDKSTGGFVEFGLPSGPAAGAQAVQLRYLYGWYRFGRCKLVIGHTDNLLASLAYAPYQWLGLSYAPGTNAEGPVVLYLNFGKRYSGRFSQVALYYDLGNWVFMVSLGAPSLTQGLNAPQAVNGAGGAINSTNNALYPRLDLVVQYKSKYFSVAPGFSIYQATYETWQGAVDLADDSQLAWLFVLPFRVSFGNFKAVGEVSYSMNWVDINALASWTAGGWYQSRNSQGNLVTDHFGDTYTLAACLGLSYNIGKATIHLGGGWQKSYNGEQLVWNHGQVTRYMFNLAVPYRVNKHFQIAPEITYAFFDYNPNHAANVDADRGSVWLIGVHFRFDF